MIYGETSFETFLRHNGNALVSGPFALNIWIYVPLTARSMILQA